MNIMKGTINLGDLGLIAAALVLLFAFDKAEQPGSPRPVKVLSSLIISSAWTLIPTNTH